MRGIYYLVHN